MVPACVARGGSRPIIIVPMQTQITTQIACPACDATYRVPAESIGEGRKVRCQRCREEWFATPAAAEVDAGPAPEAASEEAFDEVRAPGVASPEPILGLEDASGLVAIDAPEAFVERRHASASRPPAKRFAGWPRARSKGAPSSRQKVSRRPRWSAVAVAAGVAALGIMGGARVEIVRAAPALASLYELIGLPVNVRGLAIRDVRSVEDIADGGPLLLVTGVVENVSGVALDVPRLRLAVTAKGDREIYAWTTVAGRPKLEPGETATFRARLASPPAEGQAIAVRFLARRDLMASIGR